MLAVAEIREMTQPEAVAIFSRLPQAIIRSPEGTTGGN